MKNAIKLFLIDLKKIIRNPSVIIILCGIAILPSFYAWFNLDATWDPYGNTKNIKIAVVNEDNGDKVRGKKINVGNTIVDKLKKDNHFDWEFVSRKKADHDLRMGKYYAAMYIPDKFTHEITGTLRKDPQRANVEYKVNQKLNAIAPKMTDAGTSAIVQKANEQFNETVTKALLSEANRLGVKLENEIPTINKIQKAVKTANNSVPKINELAKKVLYLDQNQDQLDQYADQFRGLKQYKGDILDAQDKLNAVNSSIPALNEKAKLILALNDYLPNIKHALDVASNDVPQAFPRINRGVDMASEGVSAGKQGLNEAQGYVSSVEQRLGSYQQAIDNAQNDLNRRAQATPQSTKSTAGYSGIRVSPMSTSGEDSNNTNSFNSNDANAMESSLTKALLSLTQQTEKQSQASQQDLGALEEVTYGILASDKPQEYESTLDNLIERLQVTSKTNQQLIDILSDLENREHVDLSKEIQTLEATNNRVNHVIKLQNQLRDALKQGSSGKAEAVKVLKEIPKVDHALGDLRNYIQSDMNQRLINVSQDIMSVLNNGEAKLSTVQSKLNTIRQVIDAGQSILGDVGDRIETIQGTLPQLEQAYLNAVETAQQYYPEFQQNVERAASFVRNDLPGLEQQLANATATVNENLPALFNRYDHAVQLLDEKQPQAKEALHNLAEFIRNDLPGLEKDLAKADKLFDEAEKDDAVDKMVDLLKNDLKKQADVISNPIKINQEDVFPIKDYGSASTPFYTALSIWVGSLLMVSLLTTDNKHKELMPTISTRETYIGKSGLFYIIGILQSLIVSIGDLVILHAKVEHVGWFIGLCVLSSIVFVTIVYTFVSLLGNPGKALAIIMLVLQIAGGGGTFPIEVTPKFFQAIHPYLPFAYSIDLLREAVGGYVPEILTKKIIILSLFGIGSFIIGWTFKPIIDPIMRKAAEKAEKSDVIE
ncbi:YhgE/Pip domain-containing protein [Staphylococcus simulans]|uniref:YhgE/Pip domain-containing protein n=1 Tax=Staphylococcus simulans TaxID=1286 RepID=UPI00399AB6BC